MGTGGPKPKIHSAVVEYLNTCIQVHNFELGHLTSTDVSVLRNSQEAGCYLLKFGNKEVEIRITELPSKE